MSGGRKQAPWPVRAELWECAVWVVAAERGCGDGVRKGAERWFRLAGGVSLQLAADEASTRLRAALDTHLREAD
jgi:hypothetical protein